MSNPDVGLKTPSALTEWFTELLADQFLGEGRSGTIYRTANDKNWANWALATALLVVNDKKDNNFFGMKLVTEKEAVTRQKYQVSSSCQT